MNGKLKVSILAPEEICYTGKPYNKELGAYVFNCRNYDPEINRWTTSDPSGFPDGANNHQYTSSPLCQVDPTGLSELKDNVDWVKAVAGTNSVDIVHSFWIPQTDSIPTGDFTTVNESGYVEVKQPLTLTYGDDSGDLSVDSSTGLVLKGDQTNSAKGFSGGAGVIHVDLSASNLTYKVTASTTSSGKPKLIIDWTLKFTDTYTLGIKIKGVPLSHDFNFTNEAGNGRIILE